MRDAGRHAEAIEAYRQAIASGLSYAQVFNDLGNALIEVGDPAGAAQAYEAALARDPLLAEGHFNLASLLQEGEEVERAAGHYREAIRARADFFDAHFNLGYLMLRKGDASAALDCYAKSVALRPELPEAHFNYALALLLRGEFSRGWQEYEWRWRTADATAKPSFREPEWDGSPLQGRTILLYGEQGFGDAIQFARYASLLAADGAKVVLRVPRHLKTLLETVPGVSGCVPPSEPMPRFDVHFPLLSLPRMLKTDLSSIPAPVSYVLVDGKSARKWAIEDGASPRKLRVGLTWAAQSGNRSSKSRSCPFEIFAQLAKIEGVAFHSLQKAEPGAGPDEARLARLGIVDRTSELADFADTAALISNLDLVITVDTAVAHVAGALGKPVWTLLPFAADWRWLEQREDSPWYPSMRLFRQKEQDNWPEVVARVASELARVAALHSGPGGNEDRAAAEKNLGNEQRARGSLGQAVDSYRRSLLFAPDYVPSLYNLGLALRESGRPQEAERLFRRVQQLDPADQDALHHLAVLVLERGGFAESAGMLRRALEGAPRNPHLWYLLGKALRGHGDQSEAQACYRRALQEDPAFSEAHNDLGNALQDAGLLREAEYHYREAVRLSSDDPLMLGNLGCVLVRMNRLEEGAEHLVRATVLAPDYADAHLNLGTVRRLQGDRQGALGCFRAALALRPDDAAIRESLLTELQTVCEWNRFDELSGLQRRAALDSSQRISPFSLLSISSAADEQLQCARAFAGRYALAADGMRSGPGFNFSRLAGRRLKIGYVSADFREHAVAHLVAELIELHDRGRFEVAGYSLGPDDGSAMRARLRRAFDDFVDLRDMPHADAAARIHAGQVDILVDLQGYTQLARTEIVALRPAPLQVSYLGFTGSMGADFIDYVVVDPFVAPPGAERNFSEKLIRLPSCFQANDRSREVQAPPARRELGLPDDGFVFCCFNQSYKILPEVFGSWMRVLKQVPRSVLWLLEANVWAVENLRREAERAGVDPARLVFAPFVAQGAHLARMRAADLVLDTRPYNAHTTSSDALWVGVPVVTCPGETFASRVAGSLLDAIGAVELIAASPADYEALAIRLAHAPAELAAVRGKIERNRVFAHMFDTPTYARNLERAFELIWENYAAGNPPRAIQL